MSLTTFFHFTETSYLPLPPTRPQTQPADSPHSVPETSDQIRARGIRTAIEMLHQPELMISLNPLVQHYSRLDPYSTDNRSRLVNLNLARDFNLSLTSPPSVAKWTDIHNGEFVHYEIIDKFMLLGGLTSKLLTYRACFRPLYTTPSTAHPPPDPSTSIGLETLSDPGNGVSLLGKWILSDDEEKPGFLRLDEQVQVHCNVFMGWFVKGQLETAHASLHKEFGRRFCERMVEEEPGRGTMDGKVPGMSWKENQRRREERTQSQGKVPVVQSSREPGGGRENAPISRVGTDEMTRKKDGGQGPAPSRGGSW